MIIFYRRKDNTYKTISSVIEVVFVFNFRFLSIFLLMSTENCSPLMLVISDINKLTYRQLQVELKSRNLKSGGKTEILRERLRQALIDNNEDEQMSDYLDECSICLDKLSCDKRTTIVTTCLHQYHRICLKKWIESNGEFSLCCPLCRYSLANDRHIKQDGDKKVIV